MNIFDRRSGASAAGAALSVLVCLLLLVASGLAAHRVPASASQNAQQRKENSPDLKSFVGTWKGSFNGEVFVFVPAGGGS